MCVSGAIDNVRLVRCLCVCAAGCLCSRDVSRKLIQLKGCSDVRKQQLEQMLDILGAQQVG
jgi:hypothetical protein